jgi:hypothetical protein
MTQLGQFEQNLLTELREVVAERNTVPQPRSRKRLVLAAAGGGLLAAGLVFGLPALNGDQTPSAYAVATNDDGTVTITVNRLEDPEGLERELAAHGITADVTFTPPGKRCHHLPRYKSADIRTGFMEIDRHGDTITLRLAELAGRTLVMESRKPPMPDMEGSPIPLNIGVADGPVAPCELVDLFSGN